MKVEHFFKHYGVESSPFAEEDAESDHVFKRHCIVKTYHPAWGKVYGNPESPATAAVFGEKGSGKTALRLQIVEGLTQFNRENPGKRVFVIEYVDFNPFLDRFTKRFRSGASVEDVLAKWRLWDHMDAILSLGVTQVVDEILGTSEKRDDPNGAFRIDRAALKSLPRVSRRDLLLLAALYDQSTTLPRRDRWRLLRRRLSFSCLQWDYAIAALLPLMVLSGAVALKGAAVLASPWPWLSVPIGCLPRCIRWMRCSGDALRVERQLKSLSHQVGTLRQLFLALGSRDLENQPIPRNDQSADRYELLKKFQDVLKRLGFSGISIVVDRVDEPHLLGGAPARMRSFIWPLLDNKFLTHPGVGTKLLLPSELKAYISREGTAFYEKSRLDKHNLIQSLEWSGQSLFDIASDRLNACRSRTASEGRLSLQDLFSPEISKEELISSLDHIRVPRHLFKFLHRLIVDHCNAFTDDDPQWKFTRATFHACRAVYLKEQETLAASV